MKRSHIIGILVIAVAIFAMMTTMGDASSYETFASSKIYPNQEFHVVGTLAENRETHYDPENDPNYFSFYLKDNDGKIKKVVFNGSKPQDFEKSEQIVLTGKFSKDEFQASKILMKCPSKYNETEVTATPSTVAI